LKTPVSIFFFRRPDHLRQVLARVREARPEVVFGISDGPKPGDPETQRGVEESRRLFRKSIDWPCRMELLERETNLKSYLSVSRGLDWVFERVKETIILEDDTIPEPSFFRFACELLARYREDATVGAICGNNYDPPGTWSGNTSYRFSRYHHSWGWGTWSRAWRHFDREEKLLSRWEDRAWRKVLGLSRKEKAYWDRCFRRTYSLEIDAWDYRWTLSLWAQGMKCVIPRVNLVRNIGFDALGTNTVEVDFADHAMHEPEALRFPLTSPVSSLPDRQLDDLVFTTHYRVLEGRRNLWEKLRDRVFGKKPVSRRGRR
jgi:hypothetical protein